MLDSVELVFRGRRHKIGDARASMTLLDWLRIEQRATGTKEGCAEGDCGACTVVLARLEGGNLVHEAVNACILLLGQAHGAAVLTVEDLAGPGGTLHPVQQGMVAHHAAQCGFCTSGIVMSLYALHQNAARPVGRDAVADTLAGNLCRCTGYRPIFAAALESCTTTAEEPVPPYLAALDALESAADEDLYLADAMGFFAAPASEQSLRRLLSEHPAATLLAGGTDAGLAVTKQMRAPGKTIWLGRVAGFSAIERTPETLSIGAGASLSRAAPHLAALAEDMGEVMRRFGSVQVRNSGTVGGNIANASPIGDLPPCLIALGATLELASAAGPRTLPLEDFFLAYKRQDRRPGEYVRRLVVPVPGAGCRFMAYKVSKRLDEDISAVLAAFAFEVDGCRIARARIAFGGMAGTPARARKAEAAFAGADLDKPASWQAGIDALSDDFAPIDDHRASAAYRKLVAANLMRKALMELSGIPLEVTRLAAPRESAHAS